MAVRGASGRVALHTCRCVRRRAGRRRRRVAGLQGSGGDGPIVAVAGRTRAGTDHLHEPVADDGDERMALGPDGFAVMNGTRSGFGFGERKTALMSVGVMWVHHRAASSQSVWLVPRRYVPEWVTIDPCRGRREKQDAQPFEEVGRCGLFHGPQSDMIHPDRAGAEQFQRVDVDVLEIGARPVGEEAVPMRSPASSAAVMRRACASGAGGASGDRGIRPARSSSMRR